jgi:hypothetical protein
MPPVPLQTIQDALPVTGLFEGKEWLLSPEPLALPKAELDWIRQIGPLLHRFAQAANALYTGAETNPATNWVRQMLDRGKPDHIIRLGRSPAIREQLPRVIRPDILLTGEGLKISEIDSLPGGIGLTGWLNQFYAAHQWPVIGGACDMIDGFANVLQSGRVIFSDESLGYRPEAEWIVAEINRRHGSALEVIHAREFDATRHASEQYYRYFEVWDLANVENSEQFCALSNSGTASFSPPMKAFLEEKLWLALLWTPGLRAEWQARLGAADFEALKNIVPEGWVLDAEPLPYFTEYHGLGIQSWQELKAFSQKERRLVAKISGFSETAWGSRGVHIGHDLSTEEWSRVIDQALATVETSPFVLQRFHQARVVEHPYYDPHSGELKVMQGRVRLCPYFFEHAGNVSLGGILATICPKDKKILHGMRDSILVPCVEA